MDNSTGVSLYADLEPGTRVVATGCTYADDAGVTLNAGPPARVMGHGWRSLGAVDLVLTDDARDLPPMSTESVEVVGTWTGTALVVDGWCDDPLVVERERVCAPVPDEPQEIAVAIARSLDAEAASGAPSLGHLTDCDDTRNLVTVPVLTDAWHRWADQWKGIAFVQVRGFVTPVDDQRCYPESFSPS